MKKYKLHQVQNFTEDQLSDVLVMTIMSEGDWYLDKMDSGQYLISFGELPKFLGPNLEAMIHLFNAILQTS